MRLVIDGHSGSGKSTTAIKIAGRSSIPYVKPYSREVGEINKWLCAQNSNKLSNFRTCIDNYYLATSPENCVFDRFGPSTISLMPYNEWPPSFLLQSSSVILRADPAEIIYRLTVRGRNIWSDAQHHTYVKIFDDIAEKYDIPLVDTTELKPDDVVNQIERLLLGT